MSSEEYKHIDRGKPHASLYMNSSIQFYCAAFAAEEHFRGILNFAVIYNYSMAIELSLKAYLIHKRVIPKYIHNFREILETHKELYFLEQKLSRKEKERLEYLSFLHKEHLTRYPDYGMYSFSVNYEDRLLASKIIGILLAEFEPNFLRRIDEKAYSIFKASNKNHLRLSRQKRKDPWQRLNRRI